MKYWKFSLIALLLIVALAAAPVWSPAGAQQQPKKDPEQQKDQEPPDDQMDQDEPIRLGASLVTVPFNVNDKTNRYINDLTKDDFELLEDNKPQVIFSFERQTDLAITVALLIDISGSQEYTLPAERAAGQRFFERVLRPRKDLGAVITFEGESELVQNLTGDVEKLRRALDEVTIAAGAGGTIGGPGTPPINGGSRAGSTAIYDALYAVSNDLLRKEAGRRVIILLSDGIDTSSRIKQKEAIERTWRSEIIVYTIGIGDPAWGGVDRGKMKKIAEETGGRAFFPRDGADLDKAFAQIDEDLRSQYVLSYEPTNNAKDGSFRTINLRVRNRKDLTVRHRRGYFAPKG